MLLRGGRRVACDGARFIGTLTHWAPDLFECQFNSCDSGDVVVLETFHADSVEPLDDAANRRMASLTAESR